MNSPKNAPAFVQKLPGNGTVCPLQRQTRALTDLIDVI